MSHVLLLTLLVAADARNSAVHAAGPDSVVVPVYSSYAKPCIWESYRGYYGRVHYGWYQRPPYNYRVQMDYPWHNRPILPPPPNWFEPFPSEGHPGTETVVPLGQLTKRATPPERQKYDTAVRHPKPPSNASRRSAVRPSATLHPPLRTLDADPLKRYAADGK